MINKSCKLGWGEKTKKEKGKRTKKKACTN